MAECLQACVSRLFSEGFNSEKLETQMSTNKGMVNSQMILSSH